MCVGIMKNNVHTIRLSNLITMYYVSVLQIVYALVALSLLVLIIFKTRRQDRGRRAPEASGGWPLIGHLHRLAVREPPHRVLGDMADKYGPIFYIKLGRKPTLVISSWEIVKECFGTNDKVFLERPYNATISHAYNGAIFGLGQRSGQYWHNIRRITSHELLSTTKLDLLQNDRSSEVNICIKHLHTSCHATPTKVDVSEWSSLVCMNVTTRMVVGTSFDPKEEEWKRFVESTRDFMNLIKTFAISDVVPFTEWMDLQGHFKAVKRAIKECDRFITCWLDEHVRKRNEGKVNHDEDFVDVMLTILEKDPSLSRPHSIDVAVKSTILGLIIGGVNTTESAIKWAFLLLVNHPEILKKVQNEIDTQVGKRRWVEESDMRNLTYLIAVIKETLRLAMPLNVPRESTEDCIISGYHIPRGTNLIINVWKLHRDPRVWSNPDKFQPERFLYDNIGVHIEERDKKFTFMPFSAGRKSCFGATLAMQMMFLVMGRVLQGFDLATPEGQKVDMTEGLGLTNHRATPLELILTPRLPHELY